MISSLLSVHREINDKGLDKGTMVNDNSGYVYAYGWNRFNMGMIGAWPEKNQNFIVKNRAFVYSIIVFALIWLPMVASLPFLSEDLNELIGCLSITIPVGMSACKLALFRLRRETIAKVLSTMAKDWSTTRSSKERAAMMEKAKYSRFISIMSVLLAGSMFVSFSTIGTLAAISERRMSINDTSLAVGFLYPSYFPFDTKAWSRYLPLWLAQLIGTVFSMTGYSGPDSLMAMMILHLCGQLATVRIALVNIVDENCIEDASVYRRRLSSIVKRHEELNRFSLHYGELLEESFNAMLLIQMVLSTVLFCFQGFVTLTTALRGLKSEENFPLLQIVFFIFFATTDILHLFVYCWAGDLLIAESTALSHAPYESDWFNLQPAQAKALMMVTNRSRIPLQITAGKFVGFSLELFTSIMQTSLGYLSVLLAVKEG